MCMERGAEAACLRPVKQAWKPAIRQAPADDAAAGGGVGGGVVSQVSKPASGREGLMFS
jgi:hypothetical protein